METKTISKNNWSGELVTYKFSKNTIYLPNDYIISIKKVEDEMASIYWKNKDGKEKQLLCEAFFYNNEWSAESMGVERESQDLKDVAVEMFYNLV